MKPHEATAAAAAKLDEIAEWFKGKPIECIEHEGRRYYPESLKKRNPKTGALETHEVFVRPPSVLEMAAATRDALITVKRIFRLKLPPTQKEAVELMGETGWSETETLHICARCIFVKGITQDAPVNQYMNAEELDQKHLRASIWELYDRLDYYNKLEDPRLGELDQNVFWALVRNIGRTQNLGPLVAIAGVARDSFIITMASLLAASATAKSSAPSSETSTPEP